MTVTTYNAAGVGTNAWTNPTDAYSDNTVYATCAPAKNTSVAGIWTTFGITDPGSATLSDVEVIAQYKMSTTASIGSLKTEISWDAGSSWDAGDTTTSEPATDTDYIVSKWADTAWTWTKLNNTNLQVRVTGIRGNSSTAVTISLDVVQVRVTYTTVTNISVTDTLSASDAILRGKTFTETDTITLADAKSVNKTLPISDTLTLADSKSVNKTFTETDAIALIDSKLVDKTLTITDTATLADEITELLKFIFKSVTDTVSLSDSVLRDKALVISESIGLADTDARDRTLTETDTITLLDSIVLLAEKALADDITSEDLALVDKVLLVLDEIGLDDSVDVAKTAAPVVAPTGAGGLPFRWTVLPKKPEPPPELTPRLIFVRDVVHLTDDVRRDIASLLQDSVQLTEIVRVEKRLTITDEVHLADAIHKHRYMMILDMVSLAETVWRDAVKPMADGRMIVTRLVRERALEGAERIRALATKAKADTLWARLRNSDDPSLTRRIRDGFEKDLRECFENFKRDVEKITGQRNLADDDMFDEVDAPDWMEKFRRSIDITILTPGTKSAKKYTTQAYKAGGLRGSQFLSTIGIGATFGILPADRNAIAVLELRSVAGLEGITAEMDKQIMQTITDGVIAGDNPRDIAKDIVDRVDGIGISRAETMARTEVMTAYNVGARTQYEKYGVTQTRWLTAKDERTCDECGPLDGEVFEMDEEPRAPLHPNCRCLQLPVIPDLPSEIAEREGR